jgi:hypothetical protein
MKFVGIDYHKRYSVLCTRQTSVGRSSLSLGKGLRASHAHGHGRRRSTADLVVIARPTVAQETSEHSETANRYSRSWECMPKFDARPVD